MLPAGASIVPSIHLVHRRADIYPEPNEFLPERFLEAEGGQAPGTYTWIPFGGGIRRCLGARLRPVRDGGRAARAGLAAHAGAVAP